MKRINRKFIYGVCAILPLCVLLTSYIFMISAVPSEVLLTGEEFARTSPIVLQHGHMVTQRTNKDAVVGDDEARFINVKFLGFIPVKRVRVDLLQLDKVIVGGRLLGLHADTGDKMVTGLGTLTYINPENNNFAALGHRMNDFETGRSVDVVGGRIYKNEVIGIDRSAGKRVGTYRSSLRSGGDPEGDIHRSNAFGLYGCLRTASNLIDGDIAALSTRWNVVPGRAKLRTTLDGEVRDFDIEIVKTRYQKKPSNKSMIVRIVDKELLQRTGGIIHGMSGSPILQNGRVVGALTHVVLGDPSKGYGIYIDFMAPL